MADRTSDAPAARRPRAKVVSGAAAVSAGAERASGERARRRRRTTPLLSDLEQPTPESPPATAPPRPRVEAPGNPTTTTTPASPRSRSAGQRATPRGARKPAPAAGPGRRAADDAVASPAGAAGTSPPGGAAPSARPTRAQISGRRRPATRQTSGGERLVAVADLATEAGELIAEAVERDRAGAGGDLERRITEILAFVRRRLTGDYAVDEFGFDPELTETVLLNLTRVLYQHWFRVEVRGVDNVPTSGGALIVANHAGALPLDAMMVQIALHDEHPGHRFLRALGADLVFSSPIIGEIARKGGATLANNADAERLLATGEVVGVWPEGFKGIGKPFSERYKLQRFGRGGFVSAALRTGSPIVPCAIVGSEETYPIIGNLPTLARLLGVPYVPITPTFPLLGVLGAIPLPSKWLIEFCAPVPTDHLGAAAAEDPMLVFDLTDQVRQTIQQTLYQLLVQRQSVFF